MSHPTAVTADRTAAPTVPRPILLTAHAVAGLAAGSVISWGLTLRPSFLGSVPQAFSWAPIAVAVVGSLVALAPLVIRFAPGWTVAALGAVAFVAAQQTPAQRSSVEDLSLWLILGGVAVALVLGGALLALGTATGEARLLIAAGIAAGVLLRPAMIHMVLRWFAESESIPDPNLVLAYGAASVLIVTAVLHGVAARRGTRATGSSAPDVRRIILLASVTAGAVGIAVLPLAVSPTAAVVLAAAVSLVLAWVAHWWGGPETVRWVATAVAVGLALPSVVRLSIMANPPQAVVVALAGVGAGVILVRRTDRAAPWEAAGVLAAALALVLSYPRLAVSVPAWLGMSVLLGGACMALGAGLAGLAGRTEGRLDPPTFLGAGVLGFAAVLVAGQVSTPMTFGAGGPEVRYLVVPFVMVVVTVLLVVLFGRDRSKG